MRATPVSLLRMRKQLYSMNSNRERREGKQTVSTSKHKKDAFAEGEGVHMQDRKMATGCAVRLRRY